jgi:hypothetical protein
MINREAIFAALFALLSSSGAYTTASRRLQHWNDVSKSAQPALYMAQGAQVARTVRGYPTVWTLSVDVYIYVRTDGGLNPGPIINPLLDAIEAALAPNAAENTQTLGGLCEWCRIEGAIETDEGTLGDQAVAIIPISILVSS